MKFQWQSAPAHARPLLALKSQHLVAYLGIATVVAALSQLMLGSSFAAVAACITAVAFGLFGFAALGAYNVGAWVALFYVLGNAVIALCAKTTLGQSLDSHLYAPVDSFLALAVTSGGLLAALLLVRQLSMGRPIFEGVADPRFLAFLSWVCFGFGTLFWLLNRWFQDPSGSGFGGIAVFRDLLLMAVIARSAMLLERSGNRRAFDGWLGLIVTASVLFGLLDNSKAAAALPVVSYFTTVFIYRRKLPIKVMIIMALSGLLFTAVVAPMIHASRALGQQELDLNQRLEFLTSNMAILLEAPQEFDRYEQLAADQFQHGYYDYFGEAGTGQMLLGRYASVQQIDPVIAEVSQQGPYGGAAVWPALARLVPSFVYPDKPEYTEAFNTLVHYGLVESDGGKYPTLPLAGQAYAAYGLFGLLTIPFVTFFGFFLVMRKLGWQLYRNVYAIFFLCSFVFVYASQGDFGQYAGAALRSFPLFAILFWLIGQSFRLRLRLRRGTFRSRPSIPGRKSARQFALQRNGGKVVNDQR